MDSFEHCRTPYRTPVGEPKRVSESYDGHSEPSPLLRVRSIIAASTAMCLAALAFLLPATPSYAQQASAELRRVYIPADQLDVVINRDKRGAVLPREEFEKLFSAALANAQDVPKPPSRILATHAEWKARFEQQQLLITARIDFTHFADGWQQIHMPVNNFAIESAEVDGKPARIGRSTDRAGFVYVLSDTPGEHTLEMELSTPLAAVGSDKVAAFVPVGLASANMSVDVPAGKALMVNDVLLERPTTDGEAATYEFPLGGKGRVTLRLTDPDSRQTADVLVFANTAHGLDVSPGEITWHAITDVELFGRSVDRFVFDVPSSLEITSVDSVGLESWDLDDSTKSGRTQITLNYRQPITDRRRVEFRGVTIAMDDQPWSVPDLILANANSHVGRVIIRYPYGSRLLVNQTDGVRPTVDADESARGPAMLFDAWVGDFRLEVVTRRRERELLTDVTTVVDVAESSIEFESLAKIEVLGAPLFDVNVDVPSGWSLTDVTANDAVVDWKASTADERQSINIPFTQPIQPGAKVVVKFAARQDMDSAASDGFEFDLPEVRVPEASLSEGAFVVRTDADFRLVPLAVSGLDTVRVDGDKPDLGFQYQDAGFSARLKLEEKQPRIEARTLSFSRVDRKAFATWMEVQLQIRSGGTRSAQIELPEDTGDRVRFQIVRCGVPGVRIVEQQAAEPANNVRLWTLRFDRRVRGELTLAALLEVPRSENDDAAAMTIPKATVPSAERQNGFIAVEADGEQRIVLDFAGPALPGVDPVDLPTTTYRPRERIVAAHRYVAPDFTINVSEDRFERSTVPTAVVRELNLTSVLDRTGEVQHHAVARFLATGVQALRLMLPDNSDLWSVVLDDSPIEVRRRDGVFLIPVPPQALAEQTRELKIAFSASLPRLDLYGKIQLTPPVLAVDTGDTELQPLELLKQNWTLHYPNGTTMLASTGRFEPATALSQSSLLGQLTQSFRIPDQKTIRHQASTAGIAIAIIGLTALLLRRLSWGVSARGFGCALLVVGGLATLGVSLMLPAVQSARESARRTPTVVAESRAEAWDIKPSADDDYGGGGYGGDDYGGDDYGGAKFERDFAARQQLQEPEAAPQARSEVTLEALPDLGAIIIQDPNASVDSPTAGIEIAERQARQKGGARLSVDVGLEIPPDHTQADFRYPGAARQPGAVDLTVAYLDRSTGMVLRIAVAAFVVFVLWWLRNTPDGFRWSAAVLGIGIPVALVTVAPAAWHVVLDGTCAGSIFGILLWQLRRGVDWLRQEWRKLVAAANGQRTTVSLIFAAVALGASTTVNHAYADDTATTVIIPYEEGEVPLAARNVFLPHSAFLRLWNAAHPEDRKVAPPDVNGHVSVALWSAQLEEANSSEGRISVTGRLILESFRDEQVSLRLPLGLVALREALLDGKPAALLPVGKTRRVSGKKIANHRSGYTIAVNESGPHVLDLKFDLPARMTGPSGRFEIPLDPVAVGRLTFELPEDNLNVRVTGIKTGWRKTSNGDTTSVEIPSAPGGTVAIAWQPEQTRGAVDSVIHVENLTAAHINDVGLNIESVLTYSVRQGSLGEVTLEIPEGALLQKVAGADVGGWEFDQTDQSRALKVFLRRAVDQTTSISVQLFQPLETTKQTRTVSVPVPLATGVTRETGRIGVYTEKQFLTRAAATSGVVQINANQFMSASNKASETPQLAWRFSTRPLSVAVNVSRRDSEVIADSEHGVLVALRRLHITSRFELELRQAPQSRVVVELPDGFNPLDVNATWIRDWYPHTDEDGRRLLIVEFDQPRTGSAEVTVSGFIARDPDDTVANVVVPRPLEIDRLTSRTAIWLNPIYSATVDSEDGWSSLDPAGLSNEQKQLYKRAAQFAFTTSQLEPSTVRLNLKRLQSRLQAESATVITVTDMATDYTLNLKWRIISAAADTFVLTGPDWLAGRLEWDVAGLRQITESDPDNGRVRWTITLQEPVADEFYCMAIAVLPPPTDRRVLSPDIEFEDPGAYEPPTALETQAQYALLINQSVGQLNGADLNAIQTASVETLSIVIPPEILNEAAEFVRYRRGAPPAWNVVTYVEEQSAPASVNVADLLTVIAADGTWRTQALYTVRNRARQFLAVGLPEGSQLLSAFVKSQPVRPSLTTVDGRNVHLLPLPRTSDADLSFRVRLVLSGSLADLLDTQLSASGSNLRLPAPTIVSLQDSDEFGIPVVRMRWRVRLPDSWSGQLTSGSNMTFQPGESGEDIYMLDALREAKSLLSVASKGKSVRQRKAALDNYQTLEGQIANDTRNREEVNELRRRMAAAQVELRELQSNAIAGEVTIDDALRVQQNTVRNDKLARTNSGPSRRLQEDMFGNNFSLNSPVSVEVANGGFAGKVTGAPGDVTRRNRGEGYNLGQIEEQVRSLDRKKGLAISSGITDPFGANAPAENAEQQQWGQSRFGRIARPAETELFTTDESGQRGQRNSGRQQMAGQQQQQGIGQQAGNTTFDMSDSAVRLQASLPTTQQWSTTGGLSLPVQLAATGDELTFTKVNGSPQLTLHVRPRESSRLVIGIVWAAIWIVGVCALVLGIIKSGAAGFRATLPKLLSAAGLFTFILIPAPAAWMGFAMFVVGAIGLAWRYLRTPAAA